MRHLNVIVILLLVLGQAQAQSVKARRSTTGISGTSKVIVSQGKSIFVSQSIGQGSVSGSVRSGSNVLHQGYLQPWSNAKPIIDRKMDVSIFPNPFNDHLTVRFNTSIGNAGRVSIYDIQGRTIHSQEFTQTTDVDLDLSHLPSGLFLIEIKSNEKVSRSKIIKK